MRDGLLAYENYLRQVAREEYHIAVLTYAALAPHAKNKLRPPSRPRILDE